MKTRWGVIWLCLLSFLTTTGVYAQAHEPSFTGEYWLLAVDESYRYFDDEYALVPVETHNRFKWWGLSASGRYAIGQTWLYSFDAPWFIQSNLYLWDLTQAPVGYPTHHSMVTLSEAQANGRFAIAPDDQALALYFSDTVEVWTLPDLQPTASLKLESPQQSGRALAWSADSQALLIVQDGGNVITEWHPATDAVFNYTLNLPDDIPAYDPFLGVDVQVMASDSGWLYHLRNTASSLAFLHCLPMLSACTPYQTERDYIGAVASADGQTISVASADAALMWRWQGDHYAPVTLPVDDRAAFCPVSLSHTGRYAYAPCDHSIWDIEMGVLAQLDRRITPYWWVDDAYYVTLERDFVLRLYTVSTTEPLAVIDISALPGVNTAELTHTDALTLYTFSEDGSKLLVDLGGYLGVFGLSSAP